jgi:hypothetical protein
MTLVPGTSPERDAGARLARHQATCELPEPTIPARLSSGTAAISSPGRDAGRSPAVAWLTAGLLLARRNCPRQWPECLAGQQAGHDDLLGG